MSFNTDPSKQAQEIIFTCKVKTVVHPPMFFNTKPIQQVSSQFSSQIKAIRSKVSKTIGLKIE